MQVILYSTASRISCALTIAAMMVMTATAQAAPAPRRERPAMVTAESDAAVAKGLAFLASSQHTDGHWSAGSGYGGGYPTAMTSLAGLALLSAGNTPLEGRYALNVRRATDFLIKIAKRNRSGSARGLIANLGESRSCMHGHGFAMLFLAEVYGMERDISRQAKLKRVLQRAVELTARSQSSRGGWYYTPNSSSDEGSVTVTQIQGIRACRNAGIKTPKKLIAKACDYLAKCSNPDGSINYSFSSRSRGRPPLTAAAVATLYNAGEYDNPVAIKSLENLKKLVKLGGSASLGGGHRFYTIFYAAQAMYLSADDGKNKDNWTMYFPGCRDNLVKTQQSNGSWMGDSVGATYGTAIAIVTLQLPYGYLPIFQR